MRKLAVLLTILVVMGCSCLAEQPITQPIVHQPEILKSTTNITQYDYQAGNPTDYLQHENQQLIEQKPAENPYLKPSITDDKISHSIGGGGGGSDWNPNNYYVVPTYKVIWEGQVNYTVK